jgi:hypothetical protein
LHGSLVVPEKKKPETYQTCNQKICKLVTSWHDFCQCILTATKTMQVESFLKS